MNNREKDKLFDSAKELMAILAKIYNAWCEEKAEEEKPKAGEMPEILRELWLAGMSQDLLTRIDTDKDCLYEQINRMSRFVPEEFNLYRMKIKPIEGFLADDVICLENSDTVRETIAKIRLEKRSWDEN